MSIGMDLKVLFRRMERIAEVGRKERGVKAPSITGGDVVMPWTFVGE